MIAVRSWAYELRRTELGRVCFTR